jgi:capsular polysaccharide export protein
LANSGAHVGEIEDGFIRSVGLGANCVPPLSTIVDFTGIYFDPNQESDLENILQKDKFDEKLCRRAAALKNRLIEAEISKYGQGRNDIKLTDINRYKVLVAGQVEDDRSICTGGAGMTNLELLARARTHAPDAHIIYKPHPDVVAGHRKGHVETADALRFADEIQNNAAITSLIEAVDGVHVITSLAGFEALLRGKAVTTHGVPFYAGWGLTKDLSEVPARRTRRLSLDELVAGTLLLYPRYTDPVTRLPCSAELLVERMAQGEARISTPLITLREWQGRLRLLLRSFIRRH